MKKTENLTRKMGKRRATKDFLHLRKFTKELEEDGAPKDILDIVTEKLLVEAQSAWCGADLLYLVRTQRKGKPMKAPNQQLQDVNATAAASSGAGVRLSSSAPANERNQERYIGMLRRKDTTTGINILKLLRKGSDLEVKSNFDLTILRAIDFGSEENELLLSFDTADYNLYFQSQNERDESLWIIIQVCKHVVGIDLNVGYSIDIDSLSYIATTNGTLSRFPLLQKMISPFCKSEGALFSSEEIEAENLLDDLNWGSSLNGQHNGLLPTLAKQSARLNHEIIDFLLQWEEMDEAVMGGHHGSSNNDGRDGSNGSISGFGFGGVRDTGEVLRALAQVDHELDAADHWLGEQIERLSVVQDNLHLIEDESGQLESSWQNLLSVQDIITLLVKRYSLPEQYDQLLQQPSIILAPMMKSADLKQVDLTLTPLVQAATMVRDALTLRYDEVPRVTPARFRQLLNLTSVASQRARLTDVADSFITSFAPTAVSMFEWLLKHKSLTEPSPAGHSGDSGSGRGSLSGVISIKQFDLSGISQECLFQLHRSQSVLPPHQQQQQQQPSLVKGRSTKVTLPVWYNKCKSDQHNQLLAAQRTYHKHIQAFLPLLELFIDLSPNHTQDLRDAYVRATYERFYSPLLKTLSKDISGLTVAHKHAVINLNYFCKAANRRARGGAIPISFAGGGTGGGGSGGGGSIGSGGQAGGSAAGAGIAAVGIASGGVGSAGSGSAGGSPCSAAPTTWMALKIALTVISPVLEQEEHFIKTHLSFRNCGRHIPGLADMKIGKGAVPFSDALLQTMMEYLLDKALSKVMAALSAIVPISGPAGGGSNNGKRSRGNSLTEGADAGNSSGGAGSSSGGGGGGVSVKTKSSAGNIFSRGVAGMATGVTGVVAGVSGAASSTSGGGGMGGGGGVGGVSGVGGFGGHATEVDGVEAVAMLTTLTTFRADYMDAVIAAHTTATSSLPRGGRSGGVRFHIQEETSAAAAGGMAGEDVAEADGAKNPYTVTYLCTFMDSLQEALVNRVRTYAKEQTLWLQNQKADAKSAAVLPPFAAFPSLVAQIIEVSNGTMFECVEELLHSLTRDLFNWLNDQAGLSDKYVDKMKVTNFGHFAHCMAALQVQAPCLSSFISYAAQQKNDALQRYVQWMVAYEYPALSALALRMEGVVGMGGRVQEGELSMYIRRRDVLDVVKELELRSLETSVSTLRKRLVKHFKSDFDSELKLVERTWLTIKKRVSSILRRLEEAAAQSYQIKLEVGPKVVGEMFDRFTNEAMDDSGRSGAGGSTHE